MSVEKQSAVKEYKKRSKVKCDHCGCLCIRLRKLIKEMNMPTNIEWATETWNPVTGCTKISAGCKNCYAERMSKRLKGRYGYPEDDPFRVTLHPDKLDQPLKWRKPRRIFVCSMGDLFHEDVPDEFIDKVWGNISLSLHTFLILTKRPRRMMNTISKLKARYTRRDGTGWPLSNVHIGVSVEDQKTADERIPLLLETPAAKRFISIEPMVGPVDLVRVCDNLLHNGDLPAVDGIKQHLDQVILGGETGPGARPLNPDWVRSVRDQCKEAGVSFFYKQGPDDRRNFTKMPILDGCRYEELI